MRQLFEVEKNRLNFGVNQHRLGARKSVILSAILAGLLFTVPVTQGVHAQGVGDGTIAEELDEAANCAEMQAVTNALSNGLNNTTACGPTNVFAVETDALNETLGVAHEALNDANFGSGGGGIDVPTGAKPSPLFGAQPFSMLMLREEELGQLKMGNRASKPTTGVPFPRPTGFDSGPSEQDLDWFLSYYIKPPHVYGEEDGGAFPYPWPMEYANDPDDPSYVAEATDEYGAPPSTAGMTNPWKLDIEAYIGRELNTPPAEGRPPGQDWAHQRWEEFYPQVFVNTAQAGARPNTGLRDRIQSHDYKSGEWGPGGLYWDILRGEGPNGEQVLVQGTTDSIKPQFHPKFPVQKPNALWTWDGTFPPKLLRARYGEPILLRHYNALPVDPAANHGFGLHTLTTHEHNGHNPAESDGYTQAFFFPGQYYDYHWPMILAGTDHINKDATDPKAATPCEAGEVLRVQGVDRPCVDGSVMIPGDYKETMSTHWFHDHMLDFTAQNVYKGNAALFNYYSAIDRAKEEEDTGKCHYQDTANNVNLCLPSGKDLAWGNRDYDVNLLLTDKAWDSEGQLFFNIFNTDGFLGDQILTNLTWKPYFKVRARRYRFRIQNGAVSRYMRIALVERVEGVGGELAGPQGSNVSYNRVPFHMVANDGNIMEHAVYFDGNTTVADYQNRKGITPTLAIAERYDIVIDFAKFAPDTKLYMVNLLEHENGRRPNEEIPLAEVLNGTYHGRVGASADQADIAVPRRNSYRTDPTVSRFLEFRVHPYTVDGTPDGEKKIDGSMNPADYVAGRMKMIPRPTFTPAELATAVHRTFEFARSNGTDENPWTIKTDGGAGYNMDPRRLTAAPQQGQVEIWHLEGNGGWSHPIHIHFEEGQILTRGGKAPPEWEKWARKDVYRIGRMDDSTHSVSVALRFREFMGTYMEHCHNTQHEDHSMLLRWDVENPGQVRVMPTPMPTWDGVGYVSSTALPTARRGDDEIPVLMPPTVSLSPVNPVGVAPFFVLFGGPASDPDGTIVSRSWAFGDGATSASANITVGHIYNDPGTYTATVTVTDDTGLTASASTLVTVTATPVVDTTAPEVTAPADISVVDGDPINLGTATATDAVGPITITNDAPPTFPVGTTTVTWTATDGANNAATATQLVTVTPAAPNVAPVAVNDAIALTRGDVVTITAGFDITANDSDADGTVNPASVVITSSTLTLGGSIVETAPGVWTYTVGSGHARQGRAIVNVGESFTYTVLDNLGEVSNEATVTVTVSLAP